jgi:hypothetical protein
VKEAGYFHIDHSDEALFAVSLFWKRGENDVPAPYSSIELVLAKKGRGKGRRPVVIVTKHPYAGRQEFGSPAGSILGRCSGRAFSTYLQFALSINIIGVQVVLGVAPLCILT